MTELKGSGLATARKYYEEYGVRAKESQGRGQEGIGYLSAIVPAEILTAAGVVPLRLKGDNAEPIIRADVTPDVNSGHETLSS